MHLLRKRAFELDLKIQVRVFQAENRKDKHSIREQQQMLKGTEALKSMVMKKRNGELIDIERMNNTEEGRGSGDESEKVERGQI